VSKLEPLQIQYSALTYPDGTIVDDLLVYHLDRNHYLLCVNAANTEKDFRWIVSHRRGEVEILNTTEQYVLLSIQGPASPVIVQEITDLDISKISYYRAGWGTISGGKTLISRTGYTGEDGYEIYLAPSVSEAIWGRLLEIGKAYDMRPAGLGCRDTLRLEAKMALYGQDIDDTTTTYEAGLGWITKLDQGDFIGREILAEQKTAGVSRRLVGFEMIGRGIARQGHSVLVGGEEVGRVTSGSYSPFFRKNIGLAYLPIEFKASGTEMTILIRGREVPARVVRTPFYKRVKKGDPA